MGSRYLTDLADVCRSTGWPVIEVDGWQSRARGSGGYSGGKPDHVMVHHTASGAGSDGWPDVNYCTFSDDDAPLCNLYLSRDGTIYICAAGGTNTNGSGTDPCGLIAPDTMNSSAVGIEAGNNGTGEAWPTVQQDSYIALCSALCAAYAIDAAQIHAHHEWAPSRKVDPAGPSRYASAGSWDMDRFRTDCATGVGPPDLEEDDMTFVTYDATSGWWVMPPGLWSKQSIGSADKDALVGAGAKVVDISNELLLRIPTTYNMPWQPQ